MARNIQRIQITDTSLILAYDDGTGEMRDFVQAPVVPPPPPPVVPPSILIKGGYFDGIPDDQAKSYADQFGMTYVRMWHSISDWTVMPAANHPTFVRARKLQSLGLKTLVVFTPPEKQVNGTVVTNAGAPPATSGVAQDWFAKAAVAAGGCVNAWEIWNEPNLSQYNSDYAAHASSWVKFALIPAYAALHAAGQFVVSGGWSGGCSAFAYAITNGALSACDAIGYHPYGANVADQLAMVKQMRGMIGDKPMWITEWNLHMDKNIPQAWADALLPLAQQVAPLVQALFYFRLVATTQQAGPAGPFTAALAKNEPYYTGLQKALSAV